MRISDIGKYRTGRGAYIASLPVLTAALFTPLLEVPRKNLQSAPVKDSGVILPRRSPQRLLETLEYTVSWGILDLAKAKMELFPDPRKKPPDALRKEILTEGTTAVQLLFPIHDKSRNSFDRESGQVFFTRKDLNEGNYHKKYLARFSVKERSVHFSKSVFAGNTDTPGEKNPDARPVSREEIVRNLPAPVMDTISAIYFNRLSSKRGKPGDSFSLPIFDDGRLYSMQMRITASCWITLKINGIRETVECLMVRPDVRTSAVFHSKGEIRIWVEPNGNRRILRVESYLPYLGAIRVELTGSRGGLRGISKGSGKTTGFDAKP